MNDPSPHTPPHAPHAHATHKHVTVTTTNPDGTKTTTETRVTEETRTTRGGASMPGSGRADESGEHPNSGYSVHVGEIPPLEQVVLETVLEGVGIVQKGAEYVRRVGKIASLFLAKKD